MTATAEKPDRVGLSVVAAVVVIAAEVVRLVILSRTRWELGYPEEHAVEALYQPDGGGVVAADELRVVHERFHEQQAAA